MPVALRVLMLTLLVLFVLLRQIRRKMFMQVSCIVLTYSYNFHTFSYPPFPTSHTFVHFAYLVIKFRASFIAFPIFSAFSCIFLHVHICFTTFHIFSYILLCFPIFVIPFPMLFIPFHICSPNLAVPFPTYSPHLLLPSFYLLRRR